MRENISIVKTVATKPILSGNDKINGIEYINRKTDEVHKIKPDAAFVQIGLKPNSDFLKNW